MRDLKIEVLKMKLTGILSFLAAAILSISCALVANAHDMSAMEHDAAANSTGAMGQMGAHMDMGAHMVMTKHRPENSEDQDRARRLVETLRDGVSKYKDYKVALADDYHPFIPQVPLDIYHFTNYSQAYREYTGHFDPGHPASLLYTKTGPNQFKLVGAMYSAPAGTPEDELDRLVPLSVGRWHAHTDICLPKGLTLNDLIRGNIGADREDTPGMLPASNEYARKINHTFGFMSDGRFGFAGKITDPAQCEAAGGHFIKQAWGWMIHVYPFQSDDLKVAFSLDSPK
jgi:hypothetical protein